MKFADLMIGDYVRLVAYNEKKVLQVNYVRRDGVGFEKYAGYFDEVEPIPLTEELLKQIGFVLDKYNRMWIYFDKGGLPIFTILKRTVGFWIPVSYFGEGIVMQYVHELQHSLRLCGLNELADNFKI